MDALAVRGLRHTGLHATTLCSPTRASLLTGELVRLVAELDTDVAVSASTTDSSLAAQ